MADGVPGVEFEGRAPDPQAERINWSTVVQWCLRNPGKPRAFYGIYQNAPYQFRKRYRDIQCTSERHRFEDGRKVCDMFVTYVPSNGQ